MKIETIRDFYQNHRPAPIGRYRYLSVLVPFVRRDDGELCVLFEMRARDMEVDPGEICFPVVAAHTDGFAAVSEDYVLKGWKRLVADGKILGEPSGAITLGAVLEGLIPVKKTDKVCFFISGGSVSLEQLRLLDDVQL